MTEQQNITDQVHPDSAFTIQGEGDPEEIQAKFDAWFKGVIPNGNGKKS